MTGPQERLQSLRGSFTPTGTVAHDAPALLRQNGLSSVAAHTDEVVQEARRLAQRFGTSASIAEAAGWVHDIGLVWPRAERVTAARTFHIDLVSEEEVIPGILHQKFSAFLGRELLGLTESTVLGAAGCHSTLRPGATLMDKIVFVADKLTWSAGAAPFKSQMEQELEHSLDAAAFVYLEYMWNRRDELPVIHPWLAAAYEELSATL